MARRLKTIDWSKVLPHEDLVFILQHIEAEGWYPMATFERLGVAILTHMSGATLDAVRLWGRFSASQFAREHPQLVAENEPVETLMRLRVLRSTLFDFPAFDIPMLTDGHAHVLMSYRMGPVAEEAACFQTWGFCEGVLALAGVERPRTDFIERSWEGDARTVLDVQW